MNTEVVLSSPTVISQTGDLSDSLFEIPPHIPHSEFEALYSLLDDTDESLRTLWKTETNERVRQSLLRVIQSFQQETLMELLDIVKDAGSGGKDVDLEHAVILLSTFGYPETDRSVVQTALDAIALRAHALFMKAQQHTELALLLAINQAFFEEGQFCGSEDDTYHNPDNSYVHTLLTEKRGIPISLCAVYILVAERAGVSLHGVGMPAHFLVYHPELDIFIDTFNKGAFLSRDDCKRFINGAGFTYHPSMLDRVSNVALLLRMIRNLIFAYSKSDFVWEVAALQEVSTAIVEMMNQEDN
jgi:regulator of sirC expression with transglutaminase-like and TPR domain